MAFAYMLFRFFFLQHATLMLPAVFAMLFTRDAVAACTPIFRLQR